MDGIPTLSAIDQKMAEMRIKNLELLKRHQEIEEDRQLAQQLGATTITTTVESTKDTTMRSTIKNRSRNTTTQPHSQENQHERIQRAPARRKYENDRNDSQPQRAQRIDYNRLKRERAQETINQQYSSNNNINPELLDYAYPLHSCSDNNYANRVGSGRFNQQQRTQEQGQRRREERMRRSGTHNTGHPGGPAEFHLDMLQIPIWQNGSMQPPMHVQLLPHHANIDPLMNNPTDQLDQSGYLHNFVYPSPAQSTSFNGNGPVYFAPPPPSSQPNQSHFHQYHPTRTFENSNRHQFPHSPIFQSSPQTTVSQLSTPSTSSSQQQQQEPTADLPPRFRRLNRGDQDNRYSQQRPMSGDFERFHNSSARFNNDNRFQTRPQSFYDFSPNQQSNNNNFFRSSNTNNRYPRSNNNNNNNSLPLSAYFDTDDSSYQNEDFNNNNYWNQSYPRRRVNQQRTYQDKHQFPLSSYDPRRYGFNNNYQRRNDFNNRTNLNQRNSNNGRNHDANDIDLIEEWWEDDNTELIGTSQSTFNNDSQINSTTVDDSGNSSLSTSIHLKESILDEENNISTNDVISPPSDVSTTDSNIIDSLDQLQQQLKLEEDVEKQLDAENDTIENELLLLTKETTTYDSDHFLQWAKDQFREELKGRLTAQQIKQHDAVVTDDDDEDDVEDILLKADVDLSKFRVDPISDDDNDSQIDKMDELEDDLHEKLNIEENLKPTIVVE